MNNSFLKNVLVQTTGVLLTGLAAHWTVAPALAQDTAPPEEMKPTVVTGSYIQSQDAAGSLNVTVMDMAEPVNVGRPTLSDTLRVRLAQYAGGTGVVNPGFGNGGDGSSQISLRGLPQNATLTLVNGRRTSTSDLNLIPEAAIERVEVLNDGASAVYGSDAVAGVVNIILREDYTGMKLGAYYANTTDTDVSQFKANALLGNTTETSKFVVSVEYDTANSLMSRDRDRSISSPSQTSLTSNPGMFWNNAPPSGETAIRWNLVPTGTAFGLTAASQIPAGFDPLATIKLTGSSADKAAQLAAKVASLNAALPANSPVRYSEVIPGTTTQLPPKVPNPLGIDFDNGFPFPYYTTGYRPHEKWAGYFSGSKKVFGENLEAYVNGFYAFNTSQLDLAPSPLSGTRYVVPTANYWYNAVFPGATAPIRFSYRPVEMGPRVTYTDFQDANLVAGLKGRIGESTWHWDTAFTYDRTQIDETQTGGVIFGNFAPALGSGVAASAWNPFGYTPLFGESAVNSEDLQQSLMGKGYTKQVSSLLGWTAKANGDVFELPGGAVAASVGVEYRRETTDYNPDYALTQGLIGPYNAVQELHAVRDSMAGFGELLIPIFGKDMDIPVMKEFSVSAAIRYEDYSDVGDTGVKPRFSFRWQPFDEQVALRGSYAQGFIAPGFFDLYQEPGQDFIEIYNPYTGIREQPEDAVLTIGNPELKPIEAETWMIGTVIEPKCLKGFSFSIDYYLIQQDGIPFSSAQYIVNQWYNAGGVANASNPFGASAGSSAANPLAAQVDALADGTITQIRNVGPINTGTRLTDGIDMIATKKFETDFGTFTLMGQATRILRFEQEDFPGAGTIPYLGKFWGPGAVLDNTGFPEWRANLSLDWKYKRFSAGVTWNFVSGYKEDINGTDDFSGANADNIREVTDYNTLDLRVGYRIPWAEADLLAGVTNVTDERPPLVVSSFENYYDRRVGDLRGRMFFITLTKTF